MEASGIVDRANRANIVINTLDARGLYALEPGGDIARPDRTSRQRRECYRASASRRRPRCSSF